jgi:hypothetical protein
MGIFSELLNQSFWEYLKIQNYSIIPTSPIIAHLAIYPNLHLYFFPFPQSKEKLHTISVSAGNGIIRKKYEEAKVKLCMKFK